MLKLRTVNQSYEWVSPAAIARITPASPNSVGIRCFVRLFDGTVIECAEDAGEVAAAVDSEPRQLHGETR